ncbi:PIN domain-containing protein [Duganella sp. PWIR1]
MTIVLFDSNILLDNFNGHAAAANELFTYDDAVISSVVWMEVACLMDQAERNAFDALLLNAGIQIVHPNDDIMRRAAPPRFGATALQARVPA